MLCNKLPPNLATQHKYTFLFYIVFVGQEFESSFAGWFWLRVDLFLGLAEYLHDMTSTRTRNLTEKRGSCNIFYELILEVTYYHFHNILTVIQVSPACRRRLHKGEHQGMRNSHWQPSWRLTTISIIKIYFQKEFNKTGKTIRRYTHTRVKEFTTGIWPDTIVETG